MNRRIVLRALGPPDLTVDGGGAPPELMWRKHFGLLAYLALSPEGARQREHLTGLLWPDKDEAKARHSLNEAARAIRRACGDTILATRGDRISLDLAVIDCDLDSVEEALQAGRMDEVGALWRGDFLEGFALSDSSPFEDWLTAERSAWKRRLCDAFSREAARCCAAGRHGEATSLAARVLRADPLAESALRSAMIADALAGSAPAALERFASYSERLSGEMGAEPAADLVMLAARIRAGARSPSLGSATEPLPPLQGRARQLAIMDPWLPGRASGAAAILVSGAAGSGRTRLAREAAERSRLDGARMLRVTCVAADASQPGSVLAALLDRGLAASSGLAGTHADALAVLAGISTDVRTRYPGVAPRGADSAALLGRAFGEALLAVAGEGPIGILLDDAHLADELSLEALPAIMRLVEDAPVTLILTSRTDTKLPAPLSALRTRIGHDIQGAETTSDVLADADIEALCAHFLPGYSADDRGRLVRRLHSEAGGVALFVIEILRSLATSAPRPFVWPSPGHTTAEPLPFPLPGAVIAALTLRAGVLEPGTAAALRAAAIAGARPDAAAVAAQLNCTPREAEGWLDLLERAGFLREEDGVWVFAAEMIRVFIERELMTAAERRQARARAAAAGVWQTSGGASR